MALKGASPCRPAGRGDTRRAPTHGMAPVWPGKLSLPLVVARIPRAGSTAPLGIDGQAWARAVSCSASADADVGTSVAPGGADRGAPDPPGLDAPDADPPDADSPG